MKNNKDYQSSPQVTPPYPPQGNQNNPHAPQSQPVNNQGAPQGQPMNNQGAPQGQPNTTNFAPYSGYTYTTTVKEKKWDFSHRDGIFAALFLLVGFFFVRYWLFALPFSFGLGLTLTFVLFLILSTIYMKLNKTKITAKDCALLGVGFIFSAIFCYSGNALIKNLALIFMLVYVIYYIYAKSHNIRKITNGFFFRLLNALFVLPFSHFTAAPKSMSTSIKESKSSKLKWIIIGLVITIPITAIIIALLAYADPAFDALFNYIFSDFLNQIPLILFQFAIGVPVAFLFFGALYAGKIKYGNKVMSDEKTDELSKKVQRVSPYLLCAALTPICLVYILYFIAQSGYFLDGFQNLLPSGYDYSGYARRGFFELCVVSVINALLIWCVVTFCSRKKNLSVPVKVYCIIFSIFTILLTVTAISKMVMYMQFGLTPLRVYTTWFMLLLSILFLLMIVKIIVPSLNYQRAAVTIGIIMFGILSFANTDGMIAKYNISQYQAEEIEWMAGSSLRQLDSSAVPDVLELYQSKDSSEAVKEDCKNYLLRIYRNLPPQDVTHLNYTESHARYLLEENGFDKLAEKEYYLY